MIIYLQEVLMMIRIMLNKVVDENERKWLHKRKLQRNDRIRLKTANLARMITMRKWDNIRLNLLSIHGFSTLMLAIWTNMTTIWLATKMIVNVSIIWPNENENKKSLSVLIVVNFCGQGNSWYNTSTTVQALIGLYFLLWLLLTK